MSKKKQLGFQSALLVSVGVIAGSFAASLLAWFLDETALAVLLMAVAAAGLMSRLWGMGALKKVELQVTAEQECISVGQTLTLRYTLKNNKALPLLWLELCQDVPGRDCLRPDESFRRRAFSPEEAAYCGQEEAYMRRLAFFMGWSELQWDTIWTGERRGVYRPRDFVLRSGDGFGLTQATATLPGLQDRVLVVWPRLQPVKTEVFLRHVWSGSTGKTGWSEDPTVMKGVRAYQPGDPWKRIDWRQAARTDELMIRQFDTVTPLSILFVLDPASLEDPEEGISLVASLLLSLRRSGVACGLALPATGQKGALLLRPEDPAVTAERCLYALAELEAETATACFDEAALISACAEGCQTWLVAGSAGAVSAPALAGRLGETGARLLAERREPGVRMAREYSFREVRA